MWVAGVLAFSISPPAQSLVQSFDPLGVTHPFGSTFLNRLFAPAGRYDSVWYIQIAQHGYHSVGSNTGSQAHAFFPLYPLLLRVVDLVVGQPLISGLIVSLLCFVGSLYLLYRLALLDLSSEAARLAVWLLALFPMSLFFSTVYTEALFTVLSLAAVYCARLERWALAGLLGGLAAGTRSDGVVVLVPLVWIYLWGPRPGALRADIDWTTPLGLVRRLRPSFAWFALVPAGLFAYLGYCAASGSKLTAPLDAASSYWGRGFKGPFSEIWTAFSHAPHDLSLFFSSSDVGLTSWSNTTGGHYVTNNLIDLLWLIPTVLGLIAAWRYLPKVYFVYALLLIVASASNPSPLEPMMSYARYVMPAFPLFMGAAAWLVDRPVPRSVTLVLSAGLLAFFSALWGLWAWVA